MTSLKEIVISLIFSSVAIGLCELLISKDSFKNQMRLITSTVLIVCMLSPFLGGFELPEFNFSSFDGNYDVTESAEKSVAYAAKNEIAEILYENNITNAKIKIDTGFNENNSIIIDSIIILFDEKDKVDTNFISQQVKNKLGVKTEVGEF